MKLQLSFLSVLLIFVAAVQPLQCLQPELAKPLTTITLIATGGTIAGYPIGDGKYHIGDTNVIELLAHLPHNSRIDIKPKQIFNVGSHDIDSVLPLELERTIQTALDDPTIDGVVVTHGTDTIEETAFFLDHVLALGHKPVVLVSSTRPHTALGADGPLNLARALNTAASPESRDRGVIVVLDHQIGKGKHIYKDGSVLKTNVPIAVFDGLTPRYVSKPDRRPEQPLVDLPLPMRALPEVHILYGYQGVDERLMYCAIDWGAQGVVLVGVGEGNWPVTRIYQGWIAGLSSVRHDTAQLLSRCSAAPE